MRKASIVLIIFIAEFIILARTQFTLWPEMVMYPWFVNNGFALYRDIINPYFPLLTWILAGVTKIFGYDTRIFIYLTWGYIFITQLVFIFLVQKLFKNKSGTLISFFIFTALTIIFEGNGLWFDLICMLPLLSVLYFFVNKKYFATGIFLSISLLIKQSVASVLIGCLLFIVGEGLMTLPMGRVTNPPLRKALKIIVSLGLMIAPVFLTIMFLFIIFYQQKTLSDFFFWSIKLPLGGLQNTPGFAQWPTRRNIIVMLVAFWPVMIFLPRIMKDKILLSALIFFGATFLFAFPRFGYFHLLPAALFFAVATGKLFVRQRPLAAVYILGIMVLLTITIKRFAPFSVRFFDEETYALAKKIKNAVKGEKFFLQNSPQQIYFINNSLPPRPWATNFPWYFENTNLQSRVISGLEREKIKFIILEQYQKGDNPWAPGTYRPQALQNYIDSHFERAGLLNNNNILLQKK